MQECRLYIFLDIDGVLNHSGSQWIDGDNLSELARVVRRVRPAIVLISSWRTEMHTRHMIEFVHCMFCTGIEISDITKDFGDRYKEITDYVKRHDVKNYVILDDEDSYSGTFLEKHWVKVSFSTGLTEIHADEAMGILISGASQI